MDLLRKSWKLILGWVGNKLEHVSLDGSKVNANASKHKAMSHGRMKSEIERLEGEIHELLFEAEAIDHKEDELYGKGKQAHPVAEELKRPPEPQSPAKLRQPLPLSTITTLSSRIRAANPSRRPRRIDPQQDPHQ